MLEREFDEAKKVQTSKVREFMQSTWERFDRQKLDAMLLTDDTKYDVDKLKNIAKVVSTVPEDVKFVRKAERILKEEKKWLLKTIN